ncbi:TPA: Rab family GTPase [Legionella pneumophila]
MQDKTETIKIQVLGDTASGKSCFILRAADDIFTETRIYQIGADYKITSIDMFGNSYRAFLYDPPKLNTYQNEEAIHSLDALIITFDLTDENALKYVEDKYEQIQKYYNKIVLLVGTKSDLINERKISHEQISKKVSELNVPYFEISAKTGKNVDDVVSKAVQLVIEKNNKKIEIKAEGLEKNILSALDKYIERVDGKFYDFKFPFFKRERGIQREANCELAKKLKEKVILAIKRTDSLLDIFNDHAIEELRNGVIQTNQLHIKEGYRKTGINSSELNSIISMVQNSQEYKTPQKVN